MFYIEKYLCFDNQIVMLIEKLLDESIEFEEDMNLLEFVNYLIGVAEYSFYETKLFDELRFSMSLRKCKVMLDLNEQLYILNINADVELKNYIAWSIVDIVCDYCRQMESLNFNNVFHVNYGAIGEKNDSIII